MLAFSRRQSFRSGSAALVSLQLTPRGRPGAVRQSKPHAADSDSTQPHCDPPHLGPPESGELLDAQILDGRRASEDRAAEHEAETLEDARVVEEWHDEHEQCQRT